MPKKKIKEQEVRTYEMYCHKDLDYGFVVLCHDHNTQLVRNTVKSIRLRYGEDIPIICIADSSTNAADLKELKQYCTSYKGGDSWSSLINEGMKKTKAEWNIIVMAGTVVRAGLDTKFSYFMESELDILYPIADGKYQWEEATLNGIMMNKNTFAKVGNWSTSNPLHICKLLWAVDAVNHGCKFKAVIGTRMI